MGSANKLLFIVTILLVTFGALMIYSTTSVIPPALAKKGVNEFFFFKKHLFTIFIGFTCMMLAYIIPLSLLKKMAIPLLILSFLLLVLVFFPHVGVTAGGARRWISLWPSTFQPSELVKLSMVIFMAKYISMPGFSTDRFVSFLIPVLIMIPFQMAIIMQPDFGAAMSLAFLTLAMLFLSGVRLKYLASLTVFAIPLIIMLVMAPYRLRRITSFLDPWEDPQGSGFQLIQSFIALGSGGLTGVGIGSSQQKLAYLPESHTDFIFSIIGEEFGFIGVSIVVGLFLVLFIKGLLIASQAKSEFAYYLAGGLSLMIACQALINFAVATGLVPTKGLPLPFISYGGSSLLVNMMAIGFLMNLSRHREDRRVAETDRDILRRRKARRELYGMQREGQR